MLFAAAGLMFWVIFSIAMVCLFITVATESSWWGLFVLGCFFGALWIFGYRSNVQNTWDWVAQNPIKLIMYFIFYVLLGVGYSFVKWYLFLSDFRDKVERKENRYYTVPQISENKDKLFNWIFYWPLGLMWDLINRPFKRLFRFIYERISGSYQRMADKMFAKFKPKEINEENICAWWWHLFVCS